MPSSRAGNSAASLCFCLPVMANVSRQPMLSPSLLLLTALMLVVSGLASAKQTTHCKSGETTYFSCPIGSSGKVVSICGGPLHLTADGYNQPVWLQYQFGHLGRPELVFPATTKGSVLRFRGEHHQGQTVNSSIVVFRNASTEYSVGTLQSPLTGAAFDGVMVSRPKEKLVSLPCASQPIIASNFHILVENLVPTP